MFEVSVLSVGEVPYEEYIPTTEELYILKTKDMHIYESYCEMMYHYHKCTDISGTRSQRVSQKVLANYLFLKLDHSLGNIVGHKAVDKDEIERHIVKTGDL